MTKLSFHIRCMGILCGTALILIASGVVLLVGLMLFFWIYVEPPAFQFKTCYDADDNPVVTVMLHIQPGISCYSYPFLVEGEYDEKTLPPDKPYMEFREGADIVTGWHGDRFVVISNAAPSSFVAFETPSELCIYVDADFIMEHLGDQPRTVTSVDIPDRQLDFSDYDWPPPAEGKFVSRQLIGCTGGNSDRP